MCLLCLLLCLLPSAAANFRSNLMRSGNLPDTTLRGLEVPCLLITSAKDRMLPSIVEGESPAAAAAAAAGAAD
jgi:hypothetical protein